METAAGMAAATGTNRSGKATIGSSAAHGYQIGASPSECDSRGREGGTTDDCPYG